MISKIVRATAEFIATQGQHMQIRRRLLLFTDTEISGPVICCLFVKAMASRGE